MFEGVFTRNLAFVNPLPVLGAPKLGLALEPGRGESGPVAARHDMVAAEFMRVLERLLQREVGRCSRMHLQ